jgi:hypothetical protein
MCFGIYFAQNEPLTMELDAGLADFVSSQNPVSFLPAFAMMDRTSVVRGFAQVCLPNPGLGHDSFNR